MKYYIFILLLLASTTIYANGGDGCESCEPETVSTDDSVPSDITKLDKYLDKTTEADAVIKEMCESFHKAHGFGSLTPEDEPQYLLRKAVAKFHSVSINSKSINKKVELFWNKYNDRLICKLPKGAATKDLKWRKGSIHYAKLVIHHRSSPELFTRYLLSKKSGIKINVNAIEVHNGKNETIIDYIDKVLEDPEADLKYNIKTIKLLRKRLINRYNAKRAKELSAF